MCLQFQPGLPAPPRRVNRLRVFEHETLVAAIAGIAERAVDLVRAADFGNCRDPKYATGAIQRFEYLAALAQGAFQQELAVFVENVERDEDRRILPDDLLREHFSA